MQQQPRQQSASQLETVLLAGLVHVQPFFPFSILSQLEQSMHATHKHCMHAQLCEQRNIQCCCTTKYRTCAPCAFECLLKCTSGVSKGWVKCHDSSSRSSATGHISETGASRCEARPSQPATRLASAGLSMTACDAGAAAAVGCAACMVSFPSAAAASMLSVFDTSPAWPEPSANPAWLVENWRASFNTISPGACKAVRHAGLLESRLWQAEQHSSSCIVNPCSAPDLPSAGPGRSAQPAVVVPSATPGRVRGPHCHPS